MAVGGENWQRAAIAADVTLPETPVLEVPAKLGAIPSLDGFRALAVLIVVASHSGFGDTIPGGLGVTIFFFLSGYLITTLILDERRKSGGINVQLFYARRALRLLPPLLATLALAYSLVALGLLGGGASWEGLMSQVFYFANYFQIYFADAGSQPEGTGILWSLAVEEHFYIVFPIVVFLVFRLAGTRRTLLALFVSLIVVALVWRLWLVTHGAGELRTYYATDTRFDSILFGCVLAVWRNPARPQVESPRTQMAWSEWLAVVAGGALLLSTILYREAHFRESVRYTLQGIALMPIFYYAIRYPSSGPFRLLNTRVLARIGVLSYGIYLLHDVVVSTLAWNVDVALPAWLRFAVAVGMSIVLATLLDRYLDPYFRRKRAALH
jgi:peptidoglycan/LPS O-acetylase OafA/YrhL